MELLTPAERDDGWAVQEPRELVDAELDQAEQLGHDVGSLRARRGEADLLALHAEIPTRSARAGEFESSELDAIISALPPATPATPVTDLAGRLRGAWHGRVAGNRCGQPVEFDWPRARIREYLAERNAYPIRDYLPVGDPVDGGVRDDDIDYTVLGLLLVETYGTSLTTFDVAREWVHRIPPYQTFTAERATYQNLIREVPVESAGEFRNPYREWIGALIRADIFGFVHAGDPRAAALAVFPDAVLSHRSNGIYAAMWAAALIASAFSASSPEASVRESLRHVPPRSRLATEVNAVVDDHATGMSWDAAVDGIEARHPSTSWVHALNNAGSLTAAILWGEGDFSTTVGAAVQAGLDTDSIGATAGSWAGAFLGFDAIPSQWVEPLQGTTESAVFGFSTVSLDDLAARTLRIAAGDNQQE